jgi:hypothetical protein
LTAVTQGADDGRIVMISPKCFLASLTAVVLVGCGSNSSNSNDSGSGSSDFAGAYNATFTGTYQNTSPNNQSGSSTSSATITVTDVSASEVQLSWQVPPNPPSGTVLFLMSGSNGTLVDAGAPTSAGDAGGTAVGGSCFTGIVNGNTQTNCCTNCTVSFSGKTITQPNAGDYSGTTSQGVPYTGTYTGTWTGTRQ